MVKGWGSEGFKDHCEVKGVEHVPGGLFKNPGLDELSLESMSLV